jgi:hypothetical protein
MSSARAYARPCGPAQAVAPAAAARPPIQAKLRIGAVDDPLEREADRAADAVMRGESVGSLARAPATAQRMCSGCAGEPAEKDLIQRKCAACETSGADQDRAGEAAAAVGDGGAPLTPELRHYFEPRFGRDFSDVRLHTDSRAAIAANAIGARAYTIGADLAFARGEYAPASREGVRLIAHELTHVAQQARGAHPAIRRNVAATSTCPANTHGSPLDPLAEFTADDARAQHMSLGASNVLSFEALTFSIASLGPSYVSEAYRRRFGGPPAAAGGRFRNRITGARHATESAAQRSELNSLSDRYKQLHTMFSGPIRYFCPGNAAFTLPGCSAITCGGSFAFSCPGGRRIAICPTFWNHPLMASVDQRGGNMIHEGVHMRFGFGPHGLANRDQRIRNPECYAAFVADIYGFQSDDTSDCTPLTP